MPHEVVWRGTRAGLRRLLYRVPRYLAGDLPDPTGEVEKMYQRLGQAALQIIFTSFVIKAGQGNNSGQDEAGETWRSLAPSTVRKRKNKGTWGGGQILVEKGNLLESLKPKAGGVFGDQVLVLLSNGVAVGTKVKNKGRPYGLFHHLGTNQMPQRRLWAKWEDWPDEWRERLRDEIRNGVAALLYALIQLNYYGVGQ